jgi:hypothetical protein
MAGRGKYARGVFGQPQFQQGYTPGHGPMTDRPALGESGEGHVQEPRVLAQNEIKANALIIAEPVAAMQGPCLPIWIHSPLVDSAAMYGAYLHYLHLTGQPNFLYRIHHRFEDEDVYCFMKAVPCSDAFCRRCLHGHGGYMFRWFHKFWYNSYLQSARPGAWKLGDNEVSLLWPSQIPPVFRDLSSAKEAHRAGSDHMSEISETDDEVDDQPSEAFQALLHVSQMLSARP